MFIRWERAIQYTKIRIILLVELIELIGSGTKIFEVGCVREVVQTTYYRGDYYAEGRNYEELNQYEEKKGTNECLNHIRHTSIFEIVFWISWETRKTMDGGLTVELVKWGEILRFLGFFLYNFICF